MKADTVGVIVRGAAFVGGSVCIQFASSLGQWANEDMWPSRINWVLIITLAVGAGFNSLVSFMSGAYSEWRSARSNGKTIITQ